MRWQEIAMEAMLLALDQTPRKVKKQVLSSRLEKLLNGKAARKIEKPPQAATPLPEAENAKR